MGATFFRGQSVVASYWQVFESILSAKYQGLRRSTRRVSLRSKDETNIFAFRRVRTVDKASPHLAASLAIPELNVTDSLSFKGRHKSGVLTTDKERYTKPNSEKFRPRV